MPACPSRHKSRSHTRAARASCSSPEAGLRRLLPLARAVARHGRGSHCCCGTKERTVRSLQLTYTSLFDAIRVRAGSQLTAFFTSARIRFSSAPVSFLSAYATGHMEPSSRFALSLKPNIAYLSLNFAALRKKQTTLPSLFAYAGIPYQVLGERAGAVSLMRAL